LATIACLATSWRLGQAAPNITGPLARSRQNQLVASPDRLQFGPGRTWWKKTGRNPTDRGKLGSKHHVITDAQGIPLATTVTGANEHDVTQLLPLVEKIPGIRGKPGQPRKRPDRIQGDRAYDSEPHRQQLRAKKIEPVLAKRNTAHGSGLGTKRWPVERTISWLHQFRRLRVRYDRDPKLHQAFLTLASTLICSYFL
jgi:transposase